MKVAYSVLFIAFALGSPGSLAFATKPEKIPVAFGAWEGPHASTFKGGLRRGLKECVIVKAKAARVLIDGKVTEQENKHFSLQVVVKSAKTDEIVQTREFSFAKPTVSQAQANKMGRDVTESARRAPTE